MADSIRNLSLEDVLVALKKFTDTEKKVIEKKLWKKDKKKIEIKKALNTTFGLWRNHRRIKDGVEYVNALRRGWSKRLERT